MGRFRGNLAAVLAVIVLLLPGHLTEDVGKEERCFKERDAAKATGMVGSFDKQCEKDGTFKTEQCWASTGYCYCAHPSNGLIYDETAQRPWEGQRDVDCDTYWKTQNVRCSNLDCRLARRGNCEAETQKCGSCLEGYAEEGGECKYQGESRNVIPDIDVITDKLLNGQQTTAGKYDEGNNHVEEVRGEQTTSQNEQQGSSPQAQPQKNTPAATQYAHGINDILFLAIVVGCSVLGVIGLGIAGYCWWKLQQNVKMAADQDYPAYGVTGPSAKSQMTAGDKKLAQSAQMYHYQHQKQQMLAMEKNHGDMKRNDSDDETEEETEEGDYTVYECPGLAPTGEMEVKNPLFDHDSQPPPGSNK